MIPIKDYVKKNGDACPHTRGDDPTIFEEYNEKTFLSPHAWG